MTLLQEIQNAATDGSVDVSTVLRKARILAARLHNSDFEEWVNQELNGYPDIEGLPPYRVIPGPAFAHLRDFNHDWPSAPVMASFLPEKLRWRAETCYLKQAIASIAEMIGGKSKGGQQYKMDWPQEMAVAFGAKGYNNFECLGAWQLITSNALVGVVDTVRNRLLEFALKIERENPKAGEASVQDSSVPNDKVQPLVQNIFYGSVGNVAQHSSRFQQTANVPPSFEELQKLTSTITTHISELKLDRRQQQRAEAQIAILQMELSGDPDSNIVTQAGHSLRNIIEGAVASLVATAVQPAVWPWVQKLLEQF